MQLRLAMFSFVIALAISAHAFKDFASFTAERLKPSRLLNKQLNQAFKGLPTQSLKGNRQSTGRRLTQEPVCEWDADDATCLPSSATTLSIISEAEGSLSQFLSGAFTCTAVEDEVDCDVAAGCLWDADSERCSFVDFAVGNEESPCAVNAPATIAIFAAVNICEAETTEESCLDIPNCEWDEIGCNADALSVFFGTSFADFDAAIALVTPELVNASIDAFQVEYPRSLRDAGFDWGVALDWEVPPTDCPDGTDATVCDFTTTIVEGTMPTFLYCSQQYVDASADADCEADPHCAIDPEDGSCAPAASIFAVVQFNAIDVLIESVETETDREILATALDCATVVEETECVASCDWDPEAGDCSVSVMTILSSIVQAGDDSTDGLCAYFALLADSGCYSLVDEETCLENELCSYDPDTGCSMYSVAIVDAALIEDAALETEFQAALSDCAGLRRRACEA